MGRIVFSADGKIRAGRKVVGRHWQEGFTNRYYMFIAVRLHDRLDEGMYSAWRKCDLRDAARDKTAFDASWRFIRKERVPQRTDANPSMAVRCQIEFCRKDNLND